MCVWNRFLSVSVLARAGVLCAVTDRGRITRPPYPRSCLSFWWLRAGWLVKSDQEQQRAALVKESKELTVDATGRKHTVWLLNKGLLNWTTVTDRWLIQALSQHHGQRQSTNSTEFSSLKQQRGSLREKKSLAIRTCGYNRFGSLVDPWKLWQLLHLEISKLCISDHFWVIWYHSINMIPRCQHAKFCHTLPSCIYTTSWLLNLHEEFNTSWGDSVKLRGSQNSNKYTAHLNCSTWSQMKHLQLVSVWSSEVHWNPTPSGCKDR